MGSDAEHATRPEEEMDGKGIEEPEGPEFPPWPVRTLLVWLVGFLILSAIVGGICGIAVAVANIRFSLGLNLEEHMFIARLPVEAMYAGMVFIFIVFRLRRTPFSMRDVWISYRVKPRHVGVGLLLGGVLALLSSLLFKAVTGQVAPPPAFPMRFDWRLTLCAELLVESIMVGVVEEVFFRGLLYETLRIRFYTTGATVLSAVIFAAFHLIINPLGLMSIFFYGIIAAVLFEYTRSLNSCICFHVSFNTTKIMIYYL